MAGRPVKYIVNPVVDPVVDLDQNFVVDRPVVALVIYRVELD